MAEAKNVKLMGAEWVRLKENDAENSLIHRLKSFKGFLRDASRSYHLEALHEAQRRKNPEIAATPTTPVTLIATALEGEGAGADSDAGLSELGLSLSDLVLFVLLLGAGESETWSSAGGEGEDDFSLAGDSESEEDPFFDLGLLALFSGLLPPLLALGGDELGELSGASEEEDLGDPPPDFDDDGEGLLVGDDGDLADDDFGDDEGDLEDEEPLGGDNEGDESPANAPTAATKTNAETIRWRAIFLLFFLMVCDVCVQVSNVILLL
ncbi:hypothetical protein V6N13_110861 [Hibiscus sabdariffa]